MIQDYNNGMSQDRLKQKFKVSRTVIRRILNENGIKLRGVEETNKKDIPKKIAEKVIYNYVILKKSLCESGKEFGLTQFLVERILKEYNVKKRTYTEAKDIGRKYSINDDYFKTQSHNMAYILGFLASDGNVSKKENSISIVLDIKDIEILEKIRQELNSSRPVKIYTRKRDNDSKELFQQCKLQFWSSTIKKDLAHYNIVPNKTFILKPPELLKKEYIISYIRGYFDGDGTVTIAGKNCLSFSICSASKEILEWMRQYFINEHGIINNKVYTKTLPNGNPFYVLQYYSVKAQKIYNLLYNNNGLYLERKYQKFTQLMK